MLDSHVDVNAALCETACYPSRCPPKSTKVLHEVSCSTAVYWRGLTKTKVLFAYKGNICRSPAAQAVLKKVVERSGIADEFEIDSCGTGGSGHENWYKLDSKDHWEEHKDRTVDERMIDALKKRNLDPYSDSRPLEPEDFQNNWKDKVQLMTTYLMKGEYQGATEVPDPFHGGPEEFDKVLDMLGDACEGLLSNIESKKFATES
ncbi:hypothetical protein WJX82_011372 [Trebouxia sp. C0006]